jgi:hypothetical protein
MRGKADETEHLLGFNARAWRHRRRCQSERETENFLPSVCGEKVWLADKPTSP